MNKLLIMLIATTYLMTSEQSAIAKQSDKTDGIEQRIASPIITFFLSPLIIKTTENSKVSLDFSNIEKLSKNLLKYELLPELEPDFHQKPIGLYVSYKGFLDMTDENGQIYLPRKHAEDKITIIVTKHIYPIILEGQTVEFFVRKKGGDAAYYELTRTKDEKTGVFTWETKKIPTPTSIKIPLDALIFYAAPRDIFIPEGTTIASGGPNLVLPTAYPTKYLNKDLNALSFLKYNRRFFTPTSQETVYRYAADRYTKNLRPL